MSTKLALVSIIAVLGVYAVKASAISGATLTVTGTDLKSADGQLIVAVFDSQENYLEKPVAETVVQIGENFEGVARFRGLPPGEYAVSAFHDRNGDGRLNLFVAVPVEKYGFSNDARSLFGPPSFSKAAFEFGDEDLQISFRIR